MLLKVYFNKFDVDRSGVLTKNETVAVFANLGEKNTAGVCDRLFEEFDLDQTGSICFKEFTIGTASYIWKHLDTEGEAFKQSLDKNELEIEKGLSMQQEKERGEEGDEDEEVPEDIADLPHSTQQFYILLRSCKKMFIGTLLVVIFSDPMTDVLDELGQRIGVSSFYTAFLLAPVASNASELLTSYMYAQKKTTKSISISIQALQGAACMNNTFCLAIFMALIPFQGLIWTFTAETIRILASQVVVALFSFKKTQRGIDGILVLMTYPACLALVEVLEAPG
eukprot:FR742609.1.p1 GENE.FR742609.1~~FR742609.1.p1  ORF type:complete len:307 (+),score=42.27 FR742609.1:79-921(+)